MQFTLTLSNDLMGKNVPFQVRYFCVLLYFALKIRLTFLSIFCHSCIPSLALKEAVKFQLFSTYQLFSSHYFVETFYALLLLYCSSSFWRLLCYQLWTLAALVIETRFLFLALLLSKFITTLLDFQQGSNIDFRFFRNAPFWQKSVNWLKHQNMILAFLCYSPFKFKCLWVTPSQFFLGEWKVIFE